LLGVIVHGTLGESLVNDSSSARKKDLVINSILLVILLFVLGSEGSPVRTHYTAWSESRSESRAVAAVWEELRSVETRLAGPSAQTTPALVEFTDYGCPFCQAMESEVSEFLRSQPSVSMGVRFLPSVYRDKRSEDAAKASICAQEQGVFATIHSLTLAAMASTSDIDWEILATRAGVAELATFSDCLESEGVMVRLREDRDLAEKLGISATPTYVYHGGIRVGGASALELERLTGGK
jgi:thiol-disulfide isomerase/thioredoxin